MRHASRDGNLISSRMPPSRFLKHGIAENSEAVWGQWENVLWSVSAICHRQRPTICHPCVRCPWVSKKNKDEKILITRLFLLLHVKTACLLKSLCYKITTTPQTHPNGYLTIQKYHWPDSHYLHSRWYLLGYKTQIKWKVLNLLS